MTTNDATRRAGRTGGVEHATVTLGRKLNALGRGTAWAGRLGQLIKEEQLGLQILAKNLHGQFLESTDRHQERWRAVAQRLLQKCLSLDRVEWHIKMARLHNSQDADDTHRRMGEQER